MNRHDARPGRALRATCAAFAVLLAILVAAPACRANERILDFHSDIAVASDASMQVTETIRVRAEGNRIRHGIYRDFPTDYRDRRGNRVHVDFEPQGLTRDGKPEPFHDEAHDNGVRVYFGSADTILAPGEYTYALRYRTTRQLGFFADHDELYWNVTGDGWDFPIDTASAAVTLPGAVAASAIKVEGYTGPQGSKGTDYSAQADAPSHAVFRTTRALAAHEGLSIVASFPKGVVAAPAATQRIGWFLGDNRGVLVLCIGLLLLWGYYLVQWSRVGRDPRAGVIIPQYDPPAGLTPGALRHVEHMRWDNRCVAADLVDLAVHGALVIHEQDKVYSLQRGSGAREPLLPAESALLEDLLGDGDELALTQAHHATIAAALQDHRTNLAKADTGRYFRTNSAFVVIGALISVATLGLGMLALGDAARESNGLLLWLGCWTIAVGVLGTQAVSRWRGVARGEARTRNALSTSLFALPFIAGELGGIYLLARMIGIAFPLVALAVIVTNIIFYQLLKAPTSEGRQLLDKIAGLRLYLGVAERDDLALAKAPPLNADEFQRFLPYALALGVEKTWADRFAAAVGPAAVAAATGAMAWYQGSDSSRLSNLGSFASGFGASFSSAISSSSSAPGSSSGSGGGGSSGGGGGGGGGGGW